MSPNRARGVDVDVDILKEKVQVSSCVVFRSKNAVVCVSEAVDTKPTQPQPDSVLISRDFVQVASLRTACTPPIRALIVLIEKPAVCRVVNPAPRKLHRGGGRKEEVWEETIERQRERCWRSERGLQGATPCCSAFVCSAAVQRGETHGGVCFFRGARKR